MHSVHRAFPSVRIVTAAIDDDLDEVRLPLARGMTLGEVAADGDFSARVVAMHEEVIDFETESDGEGEEGARVGATGLEFSRTETRREVKEKLAWVVSPGMGHIG